MEHEQHKKNAIHLGMRIGGLFVIAVSTIVLAAYYILSQNVHGLLTSYTVKMMQSMSRQGVKMIESQLQNDRREVMCLADFYPTDGDSTQAVDFLQHNGGEYQLRVFYLSDSQYIASDGRVRDISSRQDVQAAFRGECAVNGPYFNEDKEFVICYSAPVMVNGEITGVVGIEKDGYLFCDLIENIRFIDSGESYIINSEGTDIAVSNRSHIEWVDTQYNAQKLNEYEANEETRSIIELEQKGLQGESGVGSYYWEDGLCYLVYVPVPSTNWVLLTGLREEEIASMTKSAFFAAISQGPILECCIGVLLLLTGLIVYWIISSMKKNEEINEKLEIIANHDALTGLFNRRFLENSLEKLWRYPVKIPCQAAVFLLDIDDFKKYNDLYGHPKGDDCLRQVASVFKDAFDGYNCSVMRYGGEEFIAVVFLLDPQHALELGQKVCRLVEKEGIPNAEGGVVTVSVGICCINSTLDLSLAQCISTADKALYEAKRTGKNRSVVMDAGPTED